MQLTQSLMLEKQNVAQLHALPQSKVLRGLRTAEEENCCHLGHAEQGEAISQRSRTSRLWYVLFSKPLRMPNSSKHTLPPTKQNQSLQPAQGLYTDSSAQLNRSALCLL